MAIVVLLLAVAGAVLPSVIDTGRDEARVAVAGGGEAFADQLRASGEQIDMSLRTVEVPDGRAVREAVASADGDASGDGPASADVGAVLGDDESVVAPTDADSQLVAAVQQAVASQRTVDALRTEGLSDQQIADVLGQGPVPVERTDPGAEDRQLVAFVVTLALYLVLVLLMTQVATGVAIEKSNRISEVLLAIVRPAPLLFGKVVGVALVGLGVVVVGVAPFAVRAVLGGQLPDGLWVGLATSGAWLLLGLALYLTLAGALGALVERQEEVGSAVMPLTILIVATYVVGVNTLESPVGGVLAVFPLTSPILMPSRIAVGAASAPEVVASLALLLSTLVVVVRFATVVYERAIVRTGRRLRIRDVVSSG